MDPAGEKPFMSRTVILPGRPGLSLIAVVSGFFMALWMWMAVASIWTGDALTGWIMLPISVAGVLISGSICFWALRKRVMDEPAMIIDEVGIYDNVSLAAAGRIRWKEADRVWLMGPKWFALLCVLPQNVTPYMESQAGLRSLLMKFNMSILGAPVLIPMTTLEIPTEDLWFRVKHLAVDTKPLVRVVT